MGSGVFSDLSEANSLVCVGELVLVGTVLLILITLENRTLEIPNAKSRGEERSDGHNPRKLVSRVFNIPILASRLLVLGTDKGWSKLRTFKAAGTECFFVSIHNDLLRI